jgi:DNA-binding NarL/FixJ family response regulator
MKENIISIYLADDYPLFRTGLSLLLEQESGFKIAGEASNGKMLLELMRQAPADVVITDIEMPEMNGIEATIALKAEFPDVPVIALTIFNEDHLIIDMLEAGASGYILKNVESAELASAIRTVVRGGNHYCSQTSIRQSKLIAHSSFYKKPSIPLSDKELEIIRLICQQYASKQIADKTNLSHRTVEKYRDRIMEKTGAENVVGIVIYAIRHGIYQV